MRRYDALSSTPKYLLSSVILLYKLKVFHESSLRQGFLQMEKIFTFVLLSSGCGRAGREYKEEHSEARAGKPNYQLAACVLG